MKPRAGHKTGDCRATRRAQRTPAALCGIFPETLRFALANSPLGSLLVARSALGVCAIAFADDAAQLRAALQRDFPAARLQRDDDGLHAEVRTVLSWLEAPRRSSPLHTALTLDLRGSAFAQRVWHALQQIPPAHTATYGEIARALGTPQSARAVGAACAANRVAIAIPCHRLRRSDGSLAGFRWGLARKKALLDLERS